MRVLSNRESTGECFFLVLNPGYFHLSIQGKILVTKAENNYRVHHHRIVDDFLLEQLDHVAVDFWTNYQLESALNLWLGQVHVS